MRKYYICLTAFDHELGSTDVTLYEDLEDLKAECPCWTACGIAEVEIKVTSIVEDPPHV